MNSELKKIGKYEVVRTLGKGAMGIVYEGFDPVIQRSVAIKTIRIQTSDAENNELKQRFIHEAKAAGVLHNPNIVAIYEYGEDTDQAFIAMELIKGTTLSEHIKKGLTHSLKYSCNIVLQILSALDYAQSQGVIHRDIKPSNIILTEDGTVKITDFGIAHIESSDLTQTGTVLGTPGYMSPEQLMGHQVDHRSDLFSTGVLLYELLTGDKAFDGSTIASIMYKVVNEDPLPPATKCPDIPGAIDDIAQKAIAKKPENRYQNAKEFALDLHDFLDSLPVDIEYLPTVKEAQTTVIRTAPSASIPSIDSWLEKLDRQPTSVTQPTAAADITGRGHHSKKSVIVSMSVAVLLLVVVSIAIYMVMPDKHTKPADDGPEVTGNIRDKAESDTIVPDIPIHQDAVSDVPMSINEQTIEMDTSLDTRVTITEPVIPVRTHEPGEVIKDCIQCPQMIVIPNGTVEVGSPDTEPGRFESEGPQHRIAIDYLFAVGIYEVTKAEYQVFIHQTRHATESCHVYDGKWQEDQQKNWENPGYKQSVWHPATCISWRDAQAYVEWLSQQTGYDYRLLSSAEWEYVARAGVQETHLWESDASTACDYANVADLSAADKFTGWHVNECNDDYTFTSPAGSFKANGHGVYDIIGNVFEWVDDCWNDDYVNAPADGSSWTAGDCTLRVLRGGSWYSRPEYQRFAFRNRFPLDTRSSSFGFRVARTL